MGNRSRSRSRQSRQRSRSASRGRSNGRPTGQRGRGRGGTRARGGRGRGGGLASLIRGLTKAVNNLTVASNGQVRPRTRDPSPVSVNRGRSRSRRRLALAEGSSGIQVPSNPTGIVGLGNLDRTDKLIVGNTIGVKKTGAASHGISATDANPDIILVKFSLLWDSWLPDVRGSLRAVIDASGKTADYNTDAKIRAAPAHFFVDLRDSFSKEITFRDLGKGCGTAKGFEIYMFFNITNRGGRDSTEDVVSYQVETLLN